MAIVLMSLYVQLSIGVLSVIPRLLLQTGRLQRMDFITASVRLALLLVAARFWLNVPTALAAATLAFCCQWLLLRRWMAGSIPPAAAPDPEMKREMLAIVRRQGPNTLYYCLQGQITVWLISVFGNTSTVANLGALSRLALMFTVIGSVMGSLVVPRYARLQDTPTLFRRYWQIVAGYASLVIFLTALAAHSPNLFLSLLGGKYMHLQRELPLMVACNGLGVIVGGIWSINASKGWITPTWLHVGVPLMTQILCLHFVNVATVRGVLFFGSASLLPEFVITLCYAMRNILRVDRQSPAPLPAQIG